MIYPKLVNNGECILFLQDPLSFPFVFEVEAISESVFRQGLPYPDELREFGAEMVAIESPRGWLDELGRSTTRLWAGLSKDSGDTPTAFLVDPSSIKPGKPSRRIRVMAT
jgi:hypothetical protein